MPHGAYGPSGRQSPGRGPGRWPSPSTPSCARPWPTAASAGCSGSASSWDSGRLPPSLHRYGPSHNPVVDRQEHPGGRRAHQHWTAKAGRRNQKARASLDPAGAAIPRCGSTRRRSGRGPARHQLTARMLHRESDGPIQSRSTSGSVPSDVPSVDQDGRPYHRNQSLPSRAPRIISQSTRPTPAIPSGQTNLTQPIPGAAASPPACRRSPRASSAPTMMGIFPSPKDRDRTPADVGSHVDKQPRPLGRAVANPEQPR